MTIGRQSAALDSTDSDNPFQFQSFKDLKRAFQEQVRISLGVQWRGRESIKETNPISAQLSEKATTEGPLSLPARLSITGRHSWIAPMWIASLLKKVRERQLCGAAEEGLQPVQRQYVYQEDQLGPPVEHQEFPFDGIFEVGKVKRRQIRFSSNKSILAMAIVVADLKPEERNVIINDLCTYKDFGCL
ncbi:unnamed protein product [Cylicostephanus goldi]|uniref:Uncharacterized protein n=1 Tax=Cylicostephanus goldi TaxID=71465 RepID=A0A3P6QFY4_CYLGO|nr:unnamed protein product [Cylicostephanus goldi]